MVDAAVGGAMVESAAAGAQTDELDLQAMLQAHERLNRQEGELQREIEILRDGLNKQSMEGKRLMASWMTAEDALKAAGTQLQTLQQVSVGGSLAGKARKEGTRETSSSLPDFWSAPPRVL